MRAAAPALADAVEGAPIDVQRALAERDLLLRVIDATARADDLDVALSLTLRELCRSTGWDYGEAWLPGPGGRSLRCSPAWYGKGPRVARFRQTSEPLVFRRGEGLPGRVYASGDSEWVDDVRREAPRIFYRAAAATQSGLGAALAVPVRDGRRVLGVLAFFMSHAGEIDSRLQLVSAVATGLGVWLQRKRGEHALRERDRLTAQLMDGVDQVFYVRESAADRFAYVSPAVEGIFGLEAAGLLRSSERWIDAVHPEDRPRIAEAWARHEDDFEAEYRIVRPDGGLRWIWDRAVAVRDDPAEPLRFVGVAEDTTAHKKLVLDLARSNADLQQFASVASHDLKAPLRAIANLSSWVGEDLREGRSEQAEARLRVLHDRVGRMRAMIDGLLEYARVGAPEDDAEPVDVGSLAREVWREIDPPAGFALDLANDLPRLHTARAPLRQVLANLLDNAVKHHDRERGRVQLSARDLHSDHEFVVADDGPGIEPDFQERVFGIFQKLAQPDGTEGSGIGLSLVRKTVERLGGWVRVQSDGQRGTAVRFTWPKRLDARSPDAGGAA